VNAAAESDETKQTLSQFAARVLDQLSLSAGLPSAAFVLVMTFLAELTRVLDPRVRHVPRSGTAVDQALADMARIGLGGALLLGLAVVVLTVVTQAFSFEAIRTLEGYWGTSRAVQFMARTRAHHHRNVLRRIESRLHDLNEQAWAGAATRLEHLQRERVAAGKEPNFTPNMIAALGDAALGRKPIVKLTDPQESLRVDQTDWRQFVSADLLRQRLDFLKRLRDYPDESRILPTRLGNVLRHHEDETGRASVETLVQDVFDQLPSSLQGEHDEQRTRLDLYCSMVFVLTFSTIIAATRLIALDQPYALGALMYGIAGVWLMNRATVASARAYGALLLVIASTRCPKRPAHPPRPPATPTALRRLWPNSEEVCSAPLADRGDPGRSAASPLALCTRSPPQHCRPKGPQAVQGLAPACLPRIQNDAPNRDCRCLGRHDLVGGLPCRAAVLLFAKAGLRRQ